MGSVQFELVLLEENLGGKFVGHPVLFRKLQYNNKFAEQSLLGPCHFFAFNIRSKIRI